MYTLEQATEKDISICYKIVDDGRRFQQAQGFIQWTAEYPSIDTICDDILNKKGYFVKTNNTPVAYMCIDFSGDPAYDSIEGRWRFDEKYAVIHRISIDCDFVGTGLSSKIFHLAEDFCLKSGVNYIRIDTGFDNKRMQHIIEKLGFVHCGTVFFKRGSRMAYDKLLCQD